MILSGCGLIINMSNFNAAITVSPNWQDYCPYTMGEFMWKNTQRMTYKEDKQTKRCHNAKSSETKENTWNRFWNPWEWLHPAHTEITYGLQNHEIINFSVETTLFVEHYYRLQQARYEMYTTIYPQLISELCFSTPASSLSLWAFMSLQLQIICDPFL